LAGPLPPLTAVNSDPWLDRFRSFLVVLLGTAVAGIACLAFYTSFEAIRAFAIRSDGITPAHAWAIPLLVDSFIVVATGADLWFVTTRRSRKWWEVLWPKVLLASAASVSFVLNVAHADPTLAARGVAAIPPAALVLGVELLMMVLRRATNLRAARVELALEAAEAAYAEQRDELPPASTTVNPLTARLTARKPAEMRASTRAALADLDLTPRSMPALPASSRPAPRSSAARASVALAGRPRDLGSRPRERTSMLVEPGDQLAPRTAAPVGAAADRLPSGLPRRNGRPPSDYAVASLIAYRILDERAGEAVSAEDLAAALADKGLEIDLRTAKRLLRELDAPVERRPGEAKTAEELVVALADKGIRIDRERAKQLLREYDTPSAPRERLSKVAAEPGRVASVSASRDAAVDRTGGGVARERAGRSR
jgi:hypothetical protein